MADSAIDYANLTRIREFTRALHRVHQIGSDEVIDREPENQTAAWRSKKPMAETNVVGVIGGRAAPQFEHSRADRIRTCPMRPCRDL
jgi:hypothetical protein